MSKIIYEIVQHDGGWAYRVNGTYSERFATHDEVRAAAAQAAQEQRQPRVLLFPHLCEQASKFDQDFGRSGAEG
jgi:hypothetical protein